MENNIDDLHEELCIGAAKRRLYELLDSTTHITRDNREEILLLSKQIAEYRQNLANIKDSDV